MIPFTAVDDTEERGAWGWPGGVKSRVLFGCVVREMPLFVDK